MTRVVIVADTGAAHARLTAAVESVHSAYIVGHGSGRARLDRIVANLGPDVVVIGRLRAAADKEARVAEVHSAAPDARVFMLDADLDPSVLGGALCEFIGSNGGRRAPALEHV